MSVDPAIISALGLDPSRTKISLHGGSGFASSFRISTTPSDSSRPSSYFVKTGSGVRAEVMFRGEHASLNAIHDAVPTLCPKSYAHGPMTSSRGEHFLATDFIDMSGPSASDGSDSGSGESLASKLARLHTTPAPIPEGYDKPMYGFPVTTCCGETPQDNSFTESWADFYAENRLLSASRAAMRNHGTDDEFGRVVERTASEVVPRLIGHGRVKGMKPVIIHGDLWNGNHGRGIVGGVGGREEVVFDPSAVYGHSEYELGIMNMFGGFGRSFWSEYEKLVPKAEPKDEWADRVLLYELYHHLNHFAIFGGGYRSGAMSIMRKLLARYGDRG
ncbi:Fructosamine-3-kinase, partial [Geosmithia morbida]